MPQALQKSTQENFFLLQVDFFFLSVKLTGKANITSIIRDSCL